MHTKKTKKTSPCQSSCDPLDAIIVFHVHKTTRPLPTPRPNVTRMSEASEKHGENKGKLYTKE